MLDHQERHPVGAKFFDDFDRSPRLGECQAGHHLIEEDELRIGGDALCHFQHFLILQRQRGRALEALPAQADALDTSSARRSADFIGMTQQRRGHHRIVNSHFGEDLDDLKAARQPLADHPVRRQTAEPLAVESDVPLIRLEKAGYYGKERGFAGAVRADDADDLTLLDEYLLRRRRPRLQTALLHR